MAARTVKKLASEVLKQLGETTGAAIVSALSELGAVVELVNVEFFNDDHQAFHDLSYPLVLARILYNDAVVGGGNIALINEEGARKLAEAIKQENGDETAETSGPLSTDALLDATRQAMNTMMLEAARVTGEVLGHEVTYSDPETHFVTGAEMLNEIYSEASSAFSTRIELKLQGESCLLVQLVPRSSIVKITRAFDELATVDYEESGILPIVPLGRILGMPVKVSVEFGETKMSFAKASELVANTVIPLERSTREPVRLLADGQVVARGYLKTREGRLTFLIEEILPSALGRVGY